MRLSYILLVFVFSSCYTQQSIVGKNEAITDQVLMGLRTGKNYHFYYNNKYVCKVQIESITDTTITGKTKSVYHEVSWRGEDSAKDSMMDSIRHEPFVHRYNEIVENTNKITTRKFNPYLTAIPVGFVVFFGAYLIINDGLDMGNPGNQ